MSRKRKRSITTYPNQPLKKRRKSKIGSSGLFLFGEDDGAFSFSKRDDSSSSEEEEEESEEEEVEVRSTQTRKTHQNLKMKSRRLKETIISTREREIHLDQTIPQTTEDFERLLFTESNNSYLWIRFMTFQLSLGEIERAREVGNKGLQKIGLKYRTDRINIFKSLMNLENFYGTDKSQENILHFCVKNCGSKKEIFLHQADLYERNKRKDQCLEYYRKKILKKYPKSRKCTLRYQRYLIRQQNFRDCHTLFLKVLENFEKSKRDSTLLKLCVQQYKFGSVVEGHRYFQHLLQKHPKRTDIWSTFIQMETNANRFDEVRKLFQRVLTVNISKFKKKRFLKRYYQFEEKHGTQKDLQYVEKVAKDFVGKELEKQQEEE